MRQPKDKAGRQEFKQGHSSEQQGTVHNQEAHHPVDRIHQLQQTIGNRAAVQFMRTILQRRNTPEKQGQDAGRSSLHSDGSSSASRRGLPEPLKSGIEQLSGFDMSQVHVHYNSDKPQTMNALAYAQGMDIHLAPGQERHLPHEAWHVVQQQRGQVKPTMQLKGEEVNDDPALEREADMMGERALSDRTSLPDRYESAADYPQSENHPSDRDLPEEVMQLQTDPKKFDTRYAGPLDITQYESRMNDLVNNIVNQVEAARIRALNWHSFEHEQSVPHLQRWYESALNFVQNPEVEPKLLHARFGYAIEELACRAIPSDIGGFTIRMQVASGHTRPDIVVNHGDDEIAWIDITSKNSEDHILGKDGSGWRRRPFVYEILYDALNLQDLIQASRDNYYNEYGKFVAGEHQIEYEEHENARTALRNEFSHFANDNDWRTGTGNATDKQRETRDILYHMAGISPDGQASLKLTRGALNYFGLNDGPFGFNRGDIGQENDLGKSMVRDLAEPNINHRKTQFTQQKILELTDFFRVHTSFSAVQQFLGMYMNHLTNREFANVGMMLKAAVMDCLMLMSMPEFTPDEAYHVQFLAADLVSRFPSSLDMQALRTWHEEAAGLIRYIEQLLQNQQEQNGNEHGSQSSSSMDGV